MADRIQPTCASSTQICLSSTFSFQRRSPIKSTSRVTQDVITHLLLTETHEAFYCEVHSPIRPLRRLSSCWRRPSTWRVDCCFSPKRSILLPLPDRPCRIRVGKARRQSDQHVGNRIFTRRRRMQTRPKSKLPSVTHGFWQGRNGKTDSRMQSGGLLPAAQSSPLKSNACSNRTMTNRMLLRIRKSVWSRSNSRTTVGCMFHQARKSFRDKRNARNARNASNTSNAGNSSNASNASNSRRRASRILPLVHQTLPLKSNVGNNKRHKLLRLVIEVTESSGSMVSWSSKANKGWAIVMTPEPSKHL